MLKFGFVTNIDKNGRVRVKFPADDGLVSGWLPTLKDNSKNNKDGSFLDIDEEVACLMDECCEDGVVLGAINTDASPLSISDRNKKYFTFSDGTHIEYDRVNHVLTADVKGVANVTAQTINYKGDLNVDGNITSTKDITDKKSSMQAIRDIYNPHTHTGNQGAPTSEPDGAM